MNQIRKSELTLLCFIYICTHTHTHIRERERERERDLRFLRSMWWLRCLEPLSRELISSRAITHKTASIWFSFDVMPGVVVLISACRISGGQLFGFNFSQRCASVVRMSACSFCCSFIRWFKLLLFSLFSVESLSFWCTGWSGTLFVVFAWMRSLACLLLSGGSTPAVFSISAVEWFSWYQGLSSSQYFELCPRVYRVSGLGRGSTFVNSTAASLGMGRNTGPPPALSSHFWLQESC